MCDEKTLRSLEVGKQPDLVVLDRDYMTVPAAGMRRIKPTAAGPWQASVFAVAGGRAFVSVLLLAPLQESPRYLSLRGPRNRLRDLFMEGRAAGTALLWATFIGVSFTVSFFTNWLTVILTHAGKSSSVGIDAIAVYSAGAMPGGLVLPVFTRWWHTNNVLLGSIVAAVASCICMGFVLPFVYNSW